MLVCPSLTGGKNYHAGAYSPDTKLMYMPLQNICMTSTSTAARPSLDELYAIRTQRPDRAGRSRTSARSKRSPSRRAARRGSASSAPAQTSLMTTAGGLLFGGDTAGRFRAYDAETGAVLWEVNLGSHVTGYPGDVRRERQAVRRHQHGRDAEHVRPRDVDAGSARRNREQSLRVRAARNALQGLRPLPRAPEVRVGAASPLLRGVGCRCAARSTATSTARRSRATTTDRSRAAALAGAYDSIGARRAVMRSNSLPYGTSVCRIAGKRARNSAIVSLCKASAAGRPSRRTAAR